jgi:hypothetical protein
MRRRSSCLDIFGQLNGAGALSFADLPAVAAMLAAVDPTGALRAWRDEVPRLAQGD